MNQKLFELIDLTIQLYKITPHGYQSRHNPIFSGCVNILQGPSRDCIDIMVENYITITLFPNDKKGIFGNNLNDKIRIFGNKLKTRVAPISEMVQLCNDVKTMDDTQLLLTWGKLDLLTNKIPINSIDYSYCKKFLVDALKELGDEECM